MWYKVRELRDLGLSKSRISRDLGIDRSTVRKYLLISEDDFHDRIGRGRNLPKKLSDYLGYVKGELQRQPYLSAAQIEDRLKEHYPDLPKVHSKTVYNFVQQVREQYGISKPKGESNRDFEQLPPTAYGEQAQVDFGEYVMQTSKGYRTKVYFFVMVLSRSRYKYVYFQDTPFSTQNAIYAHLLCFEYMQGIPRKILYDQDKVFLHDENLGDYMFTHNFGAFVSSQPFEAIFCRKKDPQSKGKIENVVGYVKKNFLRGRIYDGISELNRQALSWLSRTANAKVHGTTYKVPAAEWEIEKQYLYRLREKALKPAEDLRTYNVRKDNTVAYRGNFYTLPLGTYRGRKTTVLISKTEEQLNLYAMDKTLLATHPIGCGKGELIRNSDHNRDKSKSCTEKQQQAYQLLGSDEKAALYLDLLKKSKPRYYSDNLRALIKGLEGISLEVTRQSLGFCLENSLFNGAGFCQVAVNYQQMSVKESNPSINIAVTNASLPDAESEMYIQTSNIKTYENLIGSWNR